MTSSLFSKEPGTTTIVKIEAKKIISNRIRNPRVCGGLKEFFSLLLFFRLKCCDVCNKNK